MIKVLAFDTFGTLTDWHTGVSHVLAQQFPTIDSSQLARDWRRTYAPALAEVESGARPWTLLDELHREALDRLLRNSHGITATQTQLDAAVHAWHVIPGWPDAADSIRRLKARFIVTALSNGNVALLTEMAKLNGFDWDFVGGADIWHHYKPAREVYLGIAELMQVRADEVLMVAAHSSDLAAARSCGLQTAHIDRPREWGPEANAETPDSLNTFHANGLDDLADQLDC
ncbi:haloacid dehalogenase type II [Gordonia sp. CPCC 205333]|uniref:haloacid dehalogenase type II n=1 Tax=Gordonia sp. CPCC 205333 TaxID=3140790 RepID=UPI003AF3E51E